MEFLPPTESKGVISVGIATKEEQQGTWGLFGGFFPFGIILLKIKHFFFFF